MARRRKDRETKELFIKEDEQLALVDKSVEQELNEAQQVECLGKVFPSEKARREHYLGLLAEKLKDPEFRATPGFPKAEDEDILRLSDPPYYTACPNPFLGHVASTAASRSASLADSRGPYCSDVSEGKSDALYIAHSYHTKVPPKAIARYMLWYSEPGDVVLDAYCGSGMTGVAGDLCAAPPKRFRKQVEDEWSKQGISHVPWGRRAVVLNDVAPAATFIASNYTLNRNVKEVERQILGALETTRTEFGWMFQTQHTGWKAGERNPERWLNRDSLRAEGKPTHGNVVLVIWSEVLSCPDCSESINLWEDALDPAKAAISNPIECPGCAARRTKNDLERRLEATWDPVLRTTVRQNSFAPAFIVYEVNGQRFEKTPDPVDLEILERVRKLPAPADAPIALMMDTEGRWGNMHRAGYHAGMTHVHHFFTLRNWQVLGRLWAQVSDPGARFVLTSLLNRLSRMSSLHMKNFFRGGGGFAAGNTKGNLYIPSLSIEQSPFEYLEGRLRRSSVALKQRRMDSSCFVSTGSADELRIPDTSVDYIFIDPPFGQNLIYSELNFLWEAWLRVKTDTGAESIVDTYRGKGLSEYQARMKAGFEEMYRVLKPGKWITIEFHNSQNAVWKAIQEALQSAGFVVADVRVLDKKQGSHKQNVAAGAVKKDLVISAYRPAKELAEGFSLEAGTEQGVWDFIGSHLAHLPVVVGSDGQVEVNVERNDYLLFDRMVSFHVQRQVSVPLSAAEFYAGLQQRYPERDGMYFLPDQVAEYDRKRARAEKLRQLELFVSDEASAIQWVRQQLTHKPQSFQDLQPQFMKELQAWAKHEQTVELQEILEQNFLLYKGQGPVPSQIHSYLSTQYKTLRGLEKGDPGLVDKADGRWYVPDPGKAGDLEKLRERALLREFETYKAGKKKLKQFRTEAVRAGFKAAYDANDYDTIVSVAEKIPDSVLQEDEKLLMYYDVALMRRG